MAKKGVNKVILVGNLGQDPDIKYMPSGDCVANLSLATGESWKDKNTGQMQDKTEWHKIAVFGKLAEICGEYLRKGSQVYFEGKLQTRKWQDQSGQDKYTTEVVVDSFDGVMQMLGGKVEGSQQSQQAPQQQTPQQQSGFQQQQQGFAPQQQQGGYAPQQGFAPQSNQNPQF